MDEFGFLVMTFLLILTKNQSVKGEECCSSYYDNNWDYIDGFYCSDYCCYGVLNWLYSTQNTDIRECCSSSWRQVPSYYRDDLCLSSWIIDYIWVPIVGGVVGFVLLVGGVVVCVKMSGTKRARVGVVHHQQPGVAMVTMAHGAPGQTVSGPYTSQDPAYPPPPAAY